MKKFILIALFAISLTAINAQTISFNAYYSTNDTHIMGGDLLLSKPGGLTFGVGGSHASKTFFTSEKRNGNDYTDNSNNLSSNFPKLSNPANYQYIRETFIENRGTISGLLGYTFNSSTIVLSEFGISLQQEIKLATTGIKSNPITPHNTNHWESNTVGPKFLYGASISQYIKGRWGIMAGYNNITKFKFGIVYKITPTNMFNY